MPTCDVLVLSAFEPELAPLRTHMTPEKTPRIHVRADVVGIGLVPAALGTAARLAEWTPRVVLFMGTCGAYKKSGIALLDVVVARRIALVDAAILEGKAEFPSVVTSELATHTDLRNELVAAGAKEVDVANVLGVTIDEQLASSLEQGAFHAEHLEAFAVGLACKNAKIPFVCALGVSNEVGPQGRREWQTHHHHASEKVAKVVTRFLEKTSCVLQESRTS